MDFCIAGTRQASRVQTPLAIGYRQGLGTTGAIGAVRRCWGCRAIRVGSALHALPILDIAHGRCRHRGAIGIGRTLDALSIKAGASATATTNGCGGRRRTIRVGNAANADVVVRIADA